MTPVKPKSFMLVAGEASGDLLAAELVAALRERAPDAVFFGAGGSRMAAAGVELVHDMSRLAVVGVTDVLLRLLQLHRRLRQLLAVAIERQPDVIVGVDYGGFNLRLGHAVKEHVRNNPFSTWKPRIVQFVSPQVWASRPRRAYQLAADYDLVLSIFPFEKDWYAQRVPQLRVEFVGHPMAGRFARNLLHPPANDDRPFPSSGEGAMPVANQSPRILLLPGSRKSEMQRHLPPLLDALTALLDQFPTARIKLVLPSEGLLQMVARELINRLPSILPISAGSLTLDTVRGLAHQTFPNLEIQIGNLPEALAQADLACQNRHRDDGMRVLRRADGHVLQRVVAQLPDRAAPDYRPHLDHAQPAGPRGGVPGIIAAPIDGGPSRPRRLELLRDEPRRRNIKALLARVIASLGEPGRRNGRQRPS